METTIKKTVKASVMESIFNNSETISIRHFKCLNLDNEFDWNPNTRYKYELVIRHPEGTNAKELLNKAIKKTTVTTPTK